jgi:hypothetical protein
MMKVQDFGYLLAFYGTQKLRPKLISGDIVSTMNHKLVFALNFYSIVTKPSFFFLLSFFNLFSFLGLFVFQGALSLARTSNELHPMFLLVLLGLSRNLERNL